MLEPLRLLPRRMSSRASGRLYAGVMMFFLACVTTSFAQEPADTRAARALDNEARQIKQAQHISFLSEERSSRTGGHLWMERVAEIEDVEIRRLVCIDGNPLSPSRAKEEDERVEKSVAHADAVRRRPGRDEKSGPAWIAMISRALVFSYEGQSKGGTLLRYRPRPEFAPANYRERIVHALEGTMLIKQPEDRVAEVNARVEQPVEIGYSVLGRLEQDSRMYVERSEEPGGSWQVTHVEFHVLGRVLMLKNASQDLEMVRSAYRELPAHLTLQQAAEMTRP